MEKRKKILIIAGVIVLLAIVIILVMPRGDKRNGDTGNFQNRQNEINKDVLTE